MAHAVVTPRSSSDADASAHLPDLSRRRGLAVRLVVGVVAAAAWGVLVATWTPRGPQTTAEALWSLSLSLLVGLVAGVVSGSRWSLLVAPLGFVVAVELVRAGLEAPTVDRPVPTTYGLIALVTGRGVQGAVSVLPMVVGAAWGAGITRRLRTRPAHRTLLPALAPRGVSAVAVLLVLAVGVAVAQPGRTAPITDATGEVVAGSVAELTRIPVGGRDLGLMLRGHDAEAPVLLFLAGGPGGSELGAMTGHPLEQDFVVATLDQRGSGTSYATLDPTGSYTLQSAVLDTIEVTEYLRDRFGQDRIYLVGQSWGSLLGVLAAQERPDLYHAFIGTGQMVSPAETDRIFYEDTVTWAMEGGDLGLVERLRAIGPPPFDDILDYETLLAHEHEVYPYDRSGNAEGPSGFGEHILAGEYTLLERAHNFAAFLDTFAVLYPQLQEVDLRDDVPSLDVPVLLVEGAHEARGRSEPSAEWLAGLRAPRIEQVVLDTSGHRGIFEQPEAFRQAVVDTLRP
jgi:proline iminopeptidase